MAVMREMISLPVLLLLLSLCNNVCINRQTNVIEVNVDVMDGVQLTGKQKFVRLLPVAMLENDKIDCIKLEEHRGCSLVCTGLVGQGTSMSLCIACKRMIYVYELNRTKQRYRRVKDVSCPGLIQYISICNERLCVGYPSSFAIYSIQGDGAPVGKLLLSTSPCDSQLLFVWPIFLEFTSV